jgi:TRAP-type C4-dicarboxylate transport system substrate-binding protein
MQEAADESAVFQGGLWAKSSADSIAALEQAGVEIIRPDKALFAARVAALHESARQDPVVGPLDRRIAEAQP